MKLISLKAKAKVKVKAKSESINQVTYNKSTFAKAMVDKATNN